MALKTQGFALSALPRAPRIPGNVGVVDVKAIYDGVKQGLDTFETARRAPRSMLLADAQMQAATEQAPLATRGVLAQTEAAEQQLPIRTALLADQAAVSSRGVPLAIDKIAAEERTLAANAELQAKAQAEYPAFQAEFNRIAGTGTPPSGDPLKDAEAPAVDVDAELLTLPTKFPWLAHPAYAKDRELIVNALKTRQAAAAPPKTGLASQVRGLMELGFDDETIRGVILKQSAASPTDPAADRESRERMATAALDSREFIARSQQEHEAALAQADTDEKRAAVGEKARQALDIGEVKNKNFNATVERAIANISGGTGAVDESGIPGGAVTEAVIRNIAALFPGTPSSDLKGLVKTLQAYAGFDELKAMRAAAPGKTGASGLGQITEKELAFLQSLTANLEFSQSKKQLYDNIVTLRDAVNTAWKNARSGYEFDYGSRSRRDNLSAPSTSGVDGSAPPQVTSQEQYDAIPAGSPYRDADGNMRVKGGRG